MFVHFLGVGDNMPEEMLDATYRYEKIDLGDMGGVPYVDGLEIYGIFNYVVFQFRQSRKLPRPVL